MSHSLSQIIELFGPYQPDDGLFYNGRHSRMLKNNTRTSVIVPATAETAWWMCYLRLPSVQGAVAVGGTAAAGGDRPATTSDVLFPPKKQNSLPAKK